MSQDHSPNYKFTVEKAASGWRWCIQKRGANDGISGHAESPACARGSAQFVMGAMEALDRIGRRRF